MDEHSAQFPLGPALDFLSELWRVNHAMERVSSRMLATLGVTAQQRLIVRCVGRYPGMTAGQLARLTRVDPGTLSASLRRLEEKDTVARRRDARDRRRVTIGLTEKGNLYNVPVTPSVERAVEMLLLEIPADDVDATLRVMTLLTRCLDAEI